MKKASAKRSSKKMECGFCGKTSRAGRNVSHSHRKTHREFKANLQKVTVNLFGTPEQIILCGKCIKKLKKE